MVVEEVPEDDDDEREAPFPPTDATDGKLADDIDLLVEPGAWAGEILEESSSSISTDESPSIRRTGPSPSRRLCVYGSAPCGLLSATLVSLVGLWSSSSYPLVLHRSVVEKSPLVSLVLSSSEGWA